MVPRLASLEASTIDRRASCTTYNQFITIAWRLIFSWSEELSCDESFNVISQLIYRVWFLGRYLCRIYLISETTVFARKFSLSKVSQSSTKGKGLAKNAVDGILSTQDPRSQCAITEEQYEPWWKVDLQRKSKIHSIAITSRRDCCSSDLDGAEIRIGHNDSDWRHHYM